MPSFDVVSEFDGQEIDNAVNQTMMEVGSRFDFKGTKTQVVYDKANKTIRLEAPDELKLRALQQLLEGKCAKRQINLGFLKFGEIDTVSGGALKQNVELLSGLDKEAAKKVTKHIKDLGLKVQSQVQDEQVRVTAKSIDDLQKVIASLKTADIGRPLNFINMRS